MFMGTLFRVFRLAGSTRVGIHFLERRPMLDGTSLLHDVLVDRQQRQRCDGGRRLLLRANNYTRSSTSEKANQINKKLATAIAKP